MNDDERRARLVKDLGWVGTRRLLRRAYPQAGGADEREHSTLAEVVRNIVGEAEWRSHPNQSLMATVEKAIGKLPEQMMPRKVENEDNREPVPTECIGKSESLLAAVLYGFADNELLVQPGKREFTYSDYVTRAKELAGLRSDQDSTAKRMTRAIRQDLAVVLLAMEQKAIDDREQAQARIEEAAESEAEQVLIARDEYLTRLRDRLDAGHRIICIWGEPGTGKTTLAKQFTARLDGTARVLTIRMPPALEAPTAESLMFRQDLIEALIAEGLEPTNRSLEYALSKFRARIAGEVQAKAIIIDNVQREEMIWQLVPERPEVPVIITMHSRPRSEHIACEELHGFTETQACEFINRHLVDQDVQESTVLARILGYRPLVLEQAVLFVKGSPDISVRSLSNSLATNVAETLVTVTPPEQWDRNITSLYERILASLLEYRPSQVLLDAFLAIAGQSGTMFRELVYAFMQSDQGGSHDRPYFRAGIQELNRRGLLQEQYFPTRDTAGGPDDSDSPTVELSMHPLTYRILRSLRGEKPFEIETNYLTFLSTTDHLTSGDELSEEGLIRAQIAKASMELVQGGLPDGWLSFRVVDNRTFIAIQESHDDADTHDPYAVRYVWQEDDFLYKFNYHTRQWSKSDLEEFWELKRAIIVHTERNGSALIDWPYVPEVQLYREVIPVDSYMHRLIGPVPVSYSVKHGISVWSWCGKRFVPTSITDKGNCPDCERMADSTERLSEIELALKGSFAQISAKKPLEAAWLLLIRASLRRSLERPIEAAEDLLHSFDFLWAATDAPQYERLAIGAGIARLASDLPDIDPIRLRFMFQQLLQGISWEDSEVIYLCYSLARSLDKLGLATNALTVLDKIVETVDSGRVNRSDPNIDLGRILYEKEEIERKLGRSDEANETMRRVISESEQRDDGGRVLIATLFLSGVYLCSENPEQAREDLLRAIRLAQTQSPIDYEIIWKCMTQFARVVEGQGEATLALNTAETALRLANECLAERADLQERSLREIDRIKGTEE